MPIIRRLPLSQPLRAISTEPQISVIAVGGAGGNTVKRIAAECPGEFECVCIDRDVQSLRATGISNLIEIGTKLPRRTFVAPSIEALRNSILDDSAEIDEQINGADLVFIVTGLGGKTGTSVAPVIGNLARDRGALTIGIATTPFDFERAARMNTANKALDEFVECVDMLIVVPNERLLRTFGPDTTLLDAFAHVDHLITNIVRSIEHVVTRRGLIKLDYADIRFLFSQSGYAVATTGCASGPGRAAHAVNQALDSPLLTGVNPTNVRGVLATISGGSNLTIAECETVSNVLTSRFTDNGCIVLGTIPEQEMGDNFQVTLIISGLNESPAHFIDRR